LTRRYDKPAFDLATTAADGKIVPIIERVAWERPFCKLLHFEKQFDASDSEPRQRLLIVAPLSGHHATLLRGTVEAFLPFYDVYITDWVDARTLPLSSGRFDLDDYIDYVIAICETLSKEHDGATVHTLGVCQPAVPLSAAVALMEAQESPHVPASMTLMVVPSTQGEARPRSIFWCRSVAVHGLRKIASASCPLVTLEVDGMSIRAFSNLRASWR
jgi:poly(3-hydroxybutyrate) depolymerase